MVALDLRSVSAHWYPGRQVIGHDSKRAVSLAVSSGEWVAVVGENGIGKSTILHAIAGTANFVAGSIEVDGQLLPLRDIGARFQAGVALVPQQSLLPGDGATIQDARDLAFAHRPGLFNEVALGQLMSRFEKLKLVQSGRLLPRLFDLAVAIMTIPRVLLLDEIVPDMPGDLQNGGIYGVLRELMPWTTVLFVDHDLNRCLQVADRVLWLRCNDTPRAFSRDDRDQREALFKEIGAEVQATGQRTGDIGQLWKLVALDRSPRSQVRLALQGGGYKGKEFSEVLERLFRDFTFLQEAEPAEILSGGQRVVLLWVVAQMGGICQLPEQLLQHLHPPLRSTVGDWQKLLSKRNQ